MNTRHLRAEDLRGKRARFYLRESTQAQADRGTPLEAQRVQCERAAGELGVVLSEPHEYVRVGTGEDYSRELERATADGRAGEYDVLVVAYSSRLGRDRVEVVNAKRALERAGVVLYIAEQRIVSGAFVSMLSEGVGEVVDAQANAERRVRIAGGLRERQLAGQWVGSVPYGYRRVMVDQPNGSRSWGGMLEEEPTSAAIVRRMFEMAASGMSTRQIARVLNVEGTPGGSWTGSGVLATLRNPVYVGRMIRYRRAHQGHYYAEDDDRDGRQEIAVATPVIVAPGMWRAVAEVLDRWPAGGGRRHRSYPLSSILRCGSCGRRMTGAANGNNVRYYRCSGRAREGSCVASDVRADVVEGRFVTWMDEKLRLPPDWRERIAASYRDEPQDAGRQAKIEARLARIKNLYGWGEMDEDEYRAEVARLRTELGEARPPQPQAIEAVAAALEHLGRTWLKSDTPAALPRLLLKSAEPQAGGDVEFVVRAELEPLLAVCVPVRAQLETSGHGYTVRFSA